MTVLHQRLKDFSKESRFDTVAEIFKYIRPINSDELAELADEASMIAFNILQESEMFFE